MRGKSQRKKAARIGVAKGFGPRHGENAAEGEPVDLTKVPSDTVAAMLTPREAVLNRNAAELAGRGNIEQLNAEGNVLAKKGVDLAARGQASVPNVKVPVARVSGSGNVMKYVLPGTVRREEAVGLPKMAGGTSDMKPKPKSTKGGPQPQQQVPQYSRLPAPPQQQRGGFYPPGMGFAEGSPEVAGIGVPNPQKAYDPREQVDFKAPDISGFIKALHDEGKKQGMSQSQMTDIAKQIAGSFGGGGGYGGMPPAGNYAAAGSPTPVYGESGYPSAIPVGGYQGGISDIGYPPFIMPDAEYHADKGSTWEGAYDPAYLVQRYAGGSGDVGRFNPDFQSPDPGYFQKLSSGAYPGPNFNNPRDPNNAPDLPPIGASMTPRLDQFDTAQANYYRNLGGGFGGFGNTPPAGTPGFLQGPTQHLNYFDAAGYPYAQPVSGDENLIGGHGHGTPPRRPR